MNTANSKSTLLNNSFTSDTDNICNCLGCNELASIEILLKVSEKTIRLLVCSKCECKFQ